MQFRNAQGVIVHTGDGQPRSATRRAGVAGTRSNRQAIACIPGGQMPSAPEASMEGEVRTVTERIPVSPTSGTEVGEAQIARRLQNMVQSVVIEAASMTSNPGLQAELLEGWQPWFKRIEAFLAEDATETIAVNRTETPPAAIAVVPDGTEPASSYDALPPAAQTRPVETSQSDVVEVVFQAADESDRDVVEDLLGQGGEEDLEEEDKDEDLPQAEEDLPQAEGPADDVATPRAEDPPDAENLEIDGEGG